MSPGQDPHHRHPCRQHPGREPGRGLGLLRRHARLHTLRDAPTPAGGRLIEFAPAHTNVIVTLEPAAPNLTRGAIAIRFTTDDAGNAHAALTAAGVDTDEILRWPGVPAMFAFRNPDGNAFSITEAPRDLTRPSHRPRIAPRDDHDPRAVARSAITPSQ